MYNNKNSEDSITVALVVRRLKGVLLVGGHGRRLGGVRLVKYLAGYSRLPGGGYLLLSPLVLGATEEPNNEGHHYGDDDQDAKDDQQGHGPAVSLVPGVNKFKGGGRGRTRR